MDRVPLPAGKGLKVNRPLGLSTAIGFPEVSHTRLERSRFRGPFATPATIEVFMLIHATLGMCRIGSQKAVTSVRFFLQTTGVTKHELQL